MRRILCLAIFVGLGPNVASSAERTPAAPAAAPSVDALINQLGDRDFRKRDAAYAALRAAGTPALPALRKARTATDPEVRRRLDELIPALETAAILTPKRLTIEINRKPLKEVVEAITKQTGHKIEFWGVNEGQLVSLSVKDATFWETIDKLCESNGMVVPSQYGYGDERLRLQAQDAYVPHLYRDGILRFVANGFQYSRNIDFSTAPRTPSDAGRSRNRSESLQLTFMVFSEPRLPILGLGEVKLVEVLDDNGHSMIPPPAGADPDNPFVGRTYYRGYYGYRSYCMQSQVPLVRASERSRLVKRLKATVPVTLLVEQRPETVTSQFLKSKGTKAKFGPTTISIDDATETPAKQFQLKLTIAEEGREGDYSWTNSYHQRIEVVNDKGTKYQANSTSYGGMGNGTMQITYTYSSPDPKAGPPTKVVFQVWNTIQQQVAFEFRDLPLP